MSASISPTTTRPTSTAREYAATGWGRAGLASAADWDTVIQIRQDAILNVGFDGFLAYNWGGNGMGVTQAEQIQHEYYYRTRRVLPSQKPQWLSDSAINVNGTTIPLSWSEPKGNPLPADGFAGFITAVRSRGFTDADLDRMSKQNPAALLGLR